MKKLIILSCIVLVTFFSTNQSQAQEAYLGGITMFAGNFAPRGWAFCDGQILPINQNQSLQSILGTTYGGDGRTSFALPDLRGRLAIHAGQGPGLSDLRLGQKFGQETVTLNTNEIPSHNHTATSTTEISVNTSAGEEGIGNGKYISSHLDGFNTTPTADKFLGSSSFNGTTSNTGGSQTHNNMQPSIAIHYIICLQGTFPPRN